MLANTVKAFYSYTKEEVTTIMSRTKLNKPIMLYMTELMYLDVEIYSERMFTTKSQFIRDAIDSYLSGMGLSPATHDGTGQ